MFRIVIYKEEILAYRADFDTEEEAIEWAENHSSGIKDYQVIDLDTDKDVRASKIKEMKKKRDMILCATDWVFLPDVRIEQKHKRIYMEYRQLLRDVPQKLRDHKPVTFEKFDHWLRRNYPEEFMDGGKGQKIIYRFNYYIEKD